MFSSSGSRRPRGPPWPTSFAAGSPRSMGTSCGEVRRALGRAVRHLGRGHHPLGDRVGPEVDPGSATAGCGSTRPSSVVFTTFSETSTGVINEVREAGRGGPPFHGALIVVDAVSGLGAVSLRRTSGARRGGLGLTEASCGVPAWPSSAPTGARSTTRPPPDSQRFYFDWAKTVAGQRKSTPPDSPFTPAVGLWLRRDGPGDDRGREGLAGVRAAIASPAVRAARRCARSTWTDLRARRRQRERGRGRAA